MIKFPEHEKDLYIYHNQHKSQDYDNMMNFFEEEAKEDETTMFATPESKQKCIDTNEVWELGWYPKNYSEYIRMFGSSLEEVLEAANKIKIEIKRL